MRRRNPIRKVLFAVLIGHEWVHTLDCGHAVTRPSQKKFALCEKCGADPVWRKIQTGRGFRS